MNRLFFRFSFCFSFFLAVFLFSASAVQSQVVNIPDKAKTHFAEKYPDAKNIDWTNRVSSYTATFTNNDIKSTVYYHMDGIWDYTEQDRKFEDFPQDVKTSFSKNEFAHWKIKGTSYVENNKDEKLYRISIKKGVEKKYLFFDETGKQVKSTTTL